MSPNRVHAPPWYREPWPWILMAGPAAVVIAGLFTAWLAWRSDFRTPVKRRWRKTAAAAESPGAASVPSLDRPITVATTFAVARHRLSDEEDDDDDDDDDEDDDWDDDDEDDDDWDDDDDDDDDDWDDDDDDDDDWDDDEDEDEDDDDEDDWEDDEDED